MSASFTARYDGKCTECDEPIAVGDEAAFVDGEIVCEDCGLCHVDDWDPFDDVDIW